MKLYHRDSRNTRPGHRCEPVIRTDGSPSQLAAPPRERPTFDQWEPAPPNGTNNCGRGTPRRDNPIVGATYRILITTYKRTELLRHGLMSLGAMAEHAIVLNDGVANDGTKELVEQAGATYVFTGQRNTPKEQWRCPGFAFNIGAQMCAEADIIFLSCAEMYHLDETTIPNMVAAVEKDSHALAIPDGRDDSNEFLAAVEAGMVPTELEKLFLKLPRLAMQLPFFMAMRRERFMEIGGYDEDFTGVAFDDNDLIGRLKLMKCHLVGVDGRVVHLWHPRGSTATGDDAKQSRWAYNRSLYMRRRGMAERNVGREWGVPQE